MIVVDASVLTDFLLARSPALDAIADAIGDREHESLHAPELIELETLNALRGLVRGGTLGVGRAREAVGDLSDLRLVRYPHAPIRGRVWELRDELTAYDASYLALAEVVAGAVLLTGDQGLAAVARRELDDGHVRHVR